MAQEETNFSTLEAQQRFMAMSQEEQQRIIGQQQVEAGITHTRIQNEVDVMTLDAELAGIADSAAAQRIRSDLRDKVSEGIRQTDEALSTFLEEVRVGIKIVMAGQHCTFDNAEPQFIDYLAARLGKVPYSILLNVDDDASDMTRCVTLGSVQDKALVVGVRNGTGIVDLVSPEEIARMRQPDSVSEQQ